MISARSESPSTSTSNRDRSSSSPAGAISSRTSTFIALTILHARVELVAFLVVATVVIVTPGLVGAAYLATER